MWCKNSLKIFGISEIYAYICIVLWLCPHFKWISNRKNVTKDKLKKDFRKNDERIFLFLSGFWTGSSHSLLYKLLNLFFFLLAVIFTDFSINNWKLSNCFVKTRKLCRQNEKALLLKRENFAVKMAYLSRFSNSKSYKNGAANGCAIFSAKFGDWNFLKIFKTNEGEGVYFGAVALFFSDVIYKHIN